MWRVGFAASGVPKLRLLSRARCHRNGTKLKRFLAMPKIAVDAMGGDHAPEIVVEGAVLAARELGVEVALVGQKEPVERELSRHANSPRIEVVPAVEVVAMHESPSVALRKKDSSMKAAYEMMKRGEADAVVSAGNSGAMMAVGMFVVGRLSTVA